MNRCQYLTESADELLEVQNVHVNYLKTLLAAFMRPPIGGSVELKDSAGLIREYRIYGYSNSRAINSKMLLDKMEKHFVDSKWPPNNISSRFTIEPTKPPFDKYGKFRANFYITVEH